MFLKKITAAVTALTLVIGTVGVVYADHASNGENIASSGTWESFSVCTREDGGEWEDALKSIVSDEYPDGQTYGVDYATEGYIVDGSNSDNFQFYIVNSGWDGEYNSTTGDLVGDNPWGLTATMETLDVEPGRYYTVSFKIRSTLALTGTDDDGNAVQVTTKQILVKAYHPGNGDPSYTFESTTGIDLDGYIVLEYSTSDDDWTTVTGTFQVPDSTNYADGKLGIKFACGAFLYSRPDEIAMTGSIYVKDFKVTAGTQYTVTYKSQGKTVATEYVNPGDSPSYQSLMRKGYTLKGFTTGGTTYTSSTISKLSINSNTTLTAKWTKTKAPGKPKITVKGLKKKARVKIKKKLTNAVKYQVQYSQKKNMKSSKTKNSKKLTITVKGKRGKYLYVRVRAYNLDSAGNKVWGKYSAKKKVFIK